MNPADPFDGRPKLDLSKHFKTLPVKEGSVDRTVNQDIEEHGAHLWPGEQQYSVIDEREQAWYKRHKGYSENI